MYRPAPRPEIYTSTVSQSPNPLSPRLMAAFARLDPDQIELPAWPRSVRLACDYSLRVAMAKIETDYSEADSIAYSRFVLGNLEQRDQPHLSRRGGYRLIAAARRSQSVPSSDQAQRSHLSCNRREQSLRKS